jgi:hypothetical protein
VATQLARKSPIAMLEERMPLFLSARAMIGVFAVVVALGLAGLLAGLHNAQRAEDAAHKRFADAQALSALPPASTDAIQEDLTVVRNQLATVQAVASPPASNSTADETTTVLVRSAQNAGLSVKAISGVPSGQTKIGEVLYDTKGVRVTLDGSVGQITQFLETLGRSQPALIASLTSMTLNEVGVAHAEIIFTSFTKAIVPTPIPVATPKGGKKK